MPGATEKIRRAAQAVPGYGLFAIAMKEINLIKTQKIALALILLYPIIVIGTLGAAFSGNASIGTVDVALYAADDINGFDTNIFTEKIRQSGQVNLITVDKEENVEKLIRERKAKIGIILREPEPTQGRYVIDMLTDNSNFFSAEFFFQIASNSLRRVGFDTSREILIKLWGNLTTIKTKLGGEVGRVDSFIRQLDETEKQLKDLNKSVNEIDIAEMRSKLNEQHAFIEAAGPKIDSFDAKIKSFNTLVDSKLAAINQTRQNIKNYRQQANDARAQVHELNANLDKYKQTIAEVDQAQRAYNQSLSLENYLVTIEQQLSRSEREMDSSVGDFTAIKGQLTDTSKQLGEVRDSLKNANKDLNYFNGQLSVLGRTVDKVNALITDSMATKVQVQGQLRESKRLMQGFIEKLSELDGLNPEFVANPIILNKKQVFDAEKLDIITPMALVLLLMLTTILLTGVSFVVERNEGAYSRLMLSTTGKLELFVGKMLGQLIFAIMESAIILIIAVYVLGVKISAPPQELLASLVIISASFVALGLFVSNYTKIQSTSILAGLLLVMPMIFLSGMVVPVELMNPSIQHVSSFQPLTVGSLILSEISIKGTPLVSLWQEIAKLLMPAAIFFAFTLANRNL